jgi:hypothetical protein
LNYFFSLDTVRHTFDGDDDLDLDLDLDALRSIGCLKVTRFLVVERRLEDGVRRLEDGVRRLEDEDESHGLPYKLRIALRFRCLFV